MAEDTGFLSRWSRRKVQVARGDEVAAVLDTRPESAPAAPQSSAAASVQAEPALDRASPGAADALAESGGTDAPPAAQPASQPAPQPPTLDEARVLTPEADFRRFVARDVDPAVRNTALKALFRDPHFNVMDGLDIYIDDYSIPDPLPVGMLQRMTQSVALGLFKADAKDTADATQAGGPTAGDGAPEAPPGAGPEAQVDGAADPPSDADSAAPADAEAAPGDASQTSEQTAAEPPPAPALTPPTAAHEDTDLRLQPHDAAGHAGDRESAASQSGRQR